MTTKLLSIALVLAFALTTLTGCGGAASSVSDAQKQICTALTGLQANVEKLSTIDPATKVAEIKQIKSQVDSTVQTLKSVNQILNQPRINELVTSYDQLAASIDGISGDSLGVTADQIKATSQSVNVALAQANTALNCAK